MIVYKPGDWWQALWHFRRTKVFWVLLGRVAVVGLYVAVVVAAQLEYFRFILKVEREYFSFLGILLSLLLVFRTNTAYDQYYEGRRQWSRLIGASRNLAAVLGAALPAAAAAPRVYYARMLSNFALALEGHLRDNVAYEALEHVEGVTPELLRAADHLPTKMATMFAGQLRAPARRRRAPAGTPAPIAALPRQSAGGSRGLRAHPGHAHSALL